MYKINYFTQSKVRWVGHPALVTWNAKLLAIPIFLALMAFFRFVALHRFIDGDEGFYLLAARLVLLHKKPYVDFFYTQAPLLPYVYAGWMKVTGVSWVSAKTLAAVLTAVLGTLLYLHVSRQTRHWLAGLSAAVVFASSTLVFGFFPVVKTFSLAGLLLFGAYMLVSGDAPALSRWRTAAAGGLLGLAVDTRSYLLLLAPVFVWWIVRNTERRARLAGVVWFLGSFAAGLLPALYLFQLSPGAFVFDNLGYHAIRSGGGLLGMWRDKLATVLLVFLGNVQGNGIQASILLASSLAFRSRRPRQQYAPVFALQLGLAIAAISLLPAPVMPQYFSLCVPFLVVSAVSFASDTITETSRGRERLVAAVCVLLLGIYVVAPVRDWRNYLITGEGVPGVFAARDREDWRLSRELEVSRAIDEIATAGEVVASLFPGDIFQTPAIPYPGLESDFGLPVADLLTPEQRQKYHIVSTAELEAAFAARVPRVVVLRDQVLVSLRAAGKDKWSTGENFRRVLSDHGYYLVRSIGGVSIYVCCANWDATTVLR